MPTRFSVVVDKDRARDVERLAHEHGLTEEEVLRQLLTLGLDALDDDRPVSYRKGPGSPGQRDADT